MIAISKAAFKKQNSFHQQTGLKFKGENIAECYIWSIALYGAETWTRRKKHQKYFESFKCGAGKG